MKPIHSRYDWIEKYLRDRSTPSAPYCVNTLDAYFVEAYIRETGATFVATTIGAHKCKLLGQRPVDDDADGPAVPPCRRH